MLTRDLEPKASLQRLDLVQADDVDIPAPEKIAVLQSVLLGIPFPAGRVLFGSRSHSIVMVAQFVQQNMKELIRSSGAFGELAEVLATFLLAGDAEAPQDVAMLLDVAWVPSHPQGARPSAHRHDGRNVPSLGILALRTQNNRIEPLGKLFPVR